jgi:hypothetical protein
MTQRSCRWASASASIIFTVFPAVVAALLYAGLLQCVRKHAAVAFTRTSAITFVVTLIPDFTYIPTLDGVSNAEIAVLVVMHAIAAAIITPRSGQGPTPRQSSAERGSEPIHEQSRAASAFPHVIPAIAREQQEHVLLGIDELRTRALPRQLDRDERNGAAVPIEQELLDIDDPPLVDDVHKPRPHFDVFGHSSGSERADRQLVSADAEIKLVPSIRRVTRNAEPSPPLRQLGEEAEDALHRRIEIKRKRERSMQRPSRFGIAKSGRTWWI